MSDETSEASLADPNAGYKLAKSGYEKWLDKEGLPVVSGFGLEDVAEVPREPWPRLGGRGAYVQLRGMEGFTGMFVAEIDGGGSLNPEKHMYEEYFYVLRGNGSAQVWQTEGGPKHTFEWGPGSLFSFPVNTWHRLFNSTNKPAVLMAVTNAPIVMDIFHSEEFVFGADFAFTDRFLDDEQLYDGEGKRYPIGTSNIWETNLIPDVAHAALEASRSGKIPGGHSSFCYEMSGNTLIGHVNELGTGKYHKAHHHGGGALLFCVRSQGYSLMWPSSVGPHPYATGQEDQVVRVDFREGGIFSPPGGWFHQHFNTGHEPIRQLAFRYQGRLYPLHCWPAGRDSQSLISIRDGGTLLEPEDEDPEIRRRWEARLAQEGISSQMPEVTYADA